MSALELCEKYFETRDIYKLFNVEKTADEKEIKKSYYKLSLLVHPDRVPETQKAVATEKFKLLSKLYQILSDKNKRDLYDEQGIIDDDDENMEGKLKNWLDLWRTLFKPLTEEDINNYEKSYVGSELEKADIKKAYLSAKGCINNMINSIPFMVVDDEPRIQKIVREMIAAGEVPEYKQFTEEPERKRKRRHKKYALEAKEAEKIKAKLTQMKKSETGGSDAAGSGGGNTSLEQAIVGRMKSREDNFNSFFDNLVAKYGNDENEDDVIDFSKYKKPSKIKKPKRKSSVNGDKATDSALHTVKTGKVKKR